MEALGDILTKNSLYPHVHQNRLEFDFHHDKHRQRLATSRGTFSTSNAKMMATRELMSHNRGLNPIRDMELVEVTKNNRHLVRHLAETMNADKGEYDFSGDPVLYPHHRGTLNKGTREQFQQRVDRENKGIAHRVAHKKGRMDTSRWEGDYQRHLRLVKSLSKVKYLKQSGMRGGRVPQTSRGHKPKYQPPSADLPSRTAAPARGLQTFYRDAMVGPRDMDKKDKYSGLLPYSPRELRAVRRRAGGGVTPRSRPLTTERGAGVYRQALVALEQELTVLPMQRSLAGNYHNPTQEQLDHEAYLLQREREVQHTIEDAEDQRMLEEES